MKRKSKKLKKTTTSPKAAEQASTQEIKTENQPESSDLTQTDSIKQEEQEANDILSEEPKSCELTNSSVAKSDTKFLFIELKLISIVRNWSSVFYVWTQRRPLSKSKSLLSKK